jgi:hypothetical protein
METSRHESAPLHRRATAAICSAASALALSGCTITIERLPARPSSHPAPATFKHEETSKENYLVGKLRASVLQRNAVLDCTSKLPAPAASGEGTVEGYTQNADTDHPDVHVPLQECNLLINYAKATRKTSAPIELHNFEFTTIVHESEHVNYPFASEAAVSCYALQDTVEFAAELGANKRQQRQVLKRSQLDYRHLLPSYRSDECRDGGAYDLDPDHHGKHFPK